MPRSLEKGRFPCRIADCAPRISPGFSISQTGLKNWGRGQSVLLALVAQPALERSQPQFAGWATVLLINGNIMKMAFSYYRSELQWNYKNTCYDTPLEPCSWLAPGWHSPLNFTALVVPLSFFKVGIPCSLPKPCCILVRNIQSDCLFPRQSF